MPGQSPLLSALRERVAGLERPAEGRERAGALPFGVAAIDRHLPGGGIARGALHEAVESGVESEHAAAATLFVAGMLARLPGTVLWCLRGRDLFAPALAAVGLHPDRVLYAETRRESDVLPAMEEGLRHRGLAGVVGEAARLGLTASRRLQLAAEGSGVPGFVIRRWRSDAERRLAGEPSAVATRWRIAPAPSRAPPAPGLGRACWRVELLRCRGAEATSWLLEACDAEGRLAVPADILDRPSEVDRSFAVDGPPAGGGPPAHEIAVAPSGRRPGRGRRAA